MRFVLSKSLILSESTGFALTNWAAALNTMPAWSFAAAAPYASGRTSFSINRWLRLAIQTGRSPKDLVAEKGLTQISDAEILELMAQEALTANPGSVEDYRSGKKNALG